MAFSVHLVIAQDLGSVQAIWGEILNLILSVKTYFPEKFMFTDSGDLNIVISFGELPFSDLHESYNPQRVFLLWGK